MKEESSKEVVINWWNTMKNLFTITWKAIRDIFSSSFHLIKEPIGIFVKALWEWIKVVSVSLYKVVGLNLKLRKKEKSNGSRTKTKTS